MTRVLDIADPARGEEAGEFQGRLLGASVSVIVVDAPPGGGPRLHRHPYEEVFVVQEGSATFTAGDDVIEATGGQVVVVPAGVAHKFVNSGAGRLRQVDHVREQSSRQPLRPHQAVHLQQLGGSREGANAATSVGHLVDRCH